jgi:hypothetical protein
MVVFLNQPSVEFSFLYTTRSSLDLTFKQYIQTEIAASGGDPEESPRLTADT